MANRSNIEILNQAVAFHRAGHVEAAEANYRAVLAADKRNKDAHNLLGLILQSRADHKSAVRHFEKALKIDPKMAPAHFNCGASLAALGDVRAAIKSYRAAISCQADYIDAYLNLGALMSGDGQFAEAINVFQTLVSRAPDNDRGHYNLGHCLAQSGDHLNAERALQKALQINPRYVDALITLAKLYADTHRPTDALKTVQSALEIAPANAKALTNMAVYFSELDDHEQAIAACTKALSADANYKSAHVNRGFASLVLGRLSSGWDDYAHRRNSDGDFKFRTLDVPWPQWQGESLAGKKVLLWGEQGLGDEILYSGMVPEMASAAESCVLGCAPRLVRLFQRSFPTVSVRPLDDVLRDQSLIFDVQTSILDVGKYRRRSFTSFPNRPSYLVADSVAVADQQKKRSRTQGLQVGVSWRSFAPHIGAQKTLPLEAWQPVFEAADLNITSLQYGPEADVTADLDRIKTAFGRSITVDTDTKFEGDLDSVAALIASLDLVISVSNTMVHLAAALGVPAWLIVPQGRARLWYWFKKGYYSPWYRPVALLRGDSDLKSQLGAALSALRRMPGLTGS